MQAQTREEIESYIEDCKEVIYQHSHALRWFNFAVLIFWLGVVISFIVFAILTPLNIPIFQSPLQWIGGVAIALSVLVGIGIAGIYFNEWDSTKQPIINHQKALREAKRDLARLSRRLVYYDEYIFKHLPPPEQYMLQLPTLITSYRKRADRYRLWFVATQIVIILLSATITSLSGGWLDKYVPIPWAIPVFSAVISVMTSFTLFFKLREKGTNLQQTADDMDLEHQACTLGIGIYKGLSKTDALILFAERTEALRKEQQQRQQQLEQSSQAEQKALQPTP